MIRYPLIAAMAFGLSGCLDNMNPFMVVEAPETGDTETLDPTAPEENENVNFLYDPDAGLTMNDVTYDADADELIINNLPFDGPDGRYVRRSTFGGGGSYESIETPTTGQVKSYAVYVTADSVQAVAAAGADWGEYGFGGARVTRDDFSLPASGEYVYLGNYAGVRLREDRSGLQIVTGTARVLLDIDDFDPADGIQGTVAGVIFNRSRSWAKGGSGALVNLPPIELKTVSFDSETGNFEDGVVTTYNFEGRPRENGEYHGMIAGADGSEIGGVLVMEGTAEQQLVQYEVVDYEVTEDVDIDIGGGVIVTQTVTRTGTVNALNQAGTEAINALVDLGTPVGLLTVNGGDLPDGATETRRVTLSQVFSGNGNAREIGAFVSEDTLLP